MPEERLQKLLANAGVASRRKAEELITSGQVSVNGQTVTELGSKADLDTDQVKVNGQVISKPKHYVYYAFNKPKDVICSVRDPQGRQTVMSFFRGLPERIYPVGRLDYASEGLLLLTNDGEFANRLLTPASLITKTYLAKVNGPLTAEQEETFRRGIPMHGKKTAPAGLQLIREGDNPWYEVRLVEGRQNQIRIMFKHFGRLVEKLKRIKVAFLEIGDLKPGAYRTLTRPEMEHFRRILQLDGESAPPSAADLAAALHSPSPNAPKRRTPRPKFQNPPGKRKRPDDSRPAARKGFAAGQRESGSYERKSFGRKPDGPPYRKNRPEGDRPERGPRDDERESSRPPFRRKSADSRPAARRSDDRPFRRDRDQGDRPAGDRFRSDRPAGDRFQGDRPQGDRPQGSRPAARPGAGSARGPKKFAGPKRAGGPGPRKFAPRKGGAKVGDKGRKPR